MKYKTMDIQQKLEKIDALISIEELEFLQKDYERLLEIEEMKTRPLHREMTRLYGMIDFLGSWAMAKRDKVIFED